MIPIEVTLLGMLIDISDEYLKAKLPCDVINISWR